jgi:cleavage and polyadenylation specificity factor subunit 2
MFPFSPHEATACEYGDEIRAEDFAQAALGAAQQLFEEDTAPVAQQHAARPQQADGGAATAAAAPAEAVPTKLVTQQLALPLRCDIGLLELDFSGLADGRSVRNTLAQLQPLHTLLVGGSSEEQAALCAALGAAGAVQAPLAGERVLVGGATPSLTLLMHPLLAEQAEAALQPAGGYQVCWLEGVLQPGGAPTLAPLLEGTAALAHAGARVGDARLSDLLQLCLAQGVPAQFSAGGVLLAPGGVSVRRDQGDAEQLLLEGPLGDAYFQMKSLIEQQWRLL